MIASVVLFIVGAAAIWGSGSRLPATGKQFAGRLGISETALGLFILSIVTSLPELAVTLAAMLGEGAPDLALGNILGSNNFNVTSIVILELVFAGAFLHSVDAERYKRTCLVILLLTAFVGAGVVLGRRMGPAGLPVIAFSLPIIGIFVADSSTGGRAGEVPWRRPRHRVRTEQRGGPVSRLAWRFGFLAAVVIAGGFVMARGANGIAEHVFHVGDRTLILGQTFVGTLLVAVATSMPEVSVAYAAVRRTRSTDIALGTLLGSNTVNILVFALGAPLLFFRNAESAWAGVSVSNLVSVVTAFVLTLMVLAGITSRTRRSGAVTSRLLVVLMVPIYIVCLYLVYRSAV